ncbi:MAG: helix-turn-helix domain-containing protein [Bacteroidales bacterium]|nr:helix-turn-helix domain-containing protein [Bacteroidales bacterium]
MVTNPQLELAHKFVEFTNRNIFLTGKAGTGKTTFLHQLKAHSPKRCVVVAPTGVAAINAGGVTIHSFFQMPFGPFIPAEGRAENAQNPAGYTRISRTKINIIRSLDLLIIDEISMVRADLLDGIDEVLRRYRKTSKPFGGLQLLMIGDIRQLSPVVKEEDRKLLSPFYSSFYFYGSRALQKTDFISIELTEVFRQTDDQFITILNGIRNKNLNHEQLEQLNKRYLPDFEGGEGYIILTTHNHKAKEINDGRLKALSVKSYSWEAYIGGDFPEYIYPTEQQLELKKGAQVMFIKNDPSPEKQFYNGKIGYVEEIDPEDDIIYVRCEEDGEQIAVERLKWENCKYSLNEKTKEIEEEVVGSFTQFPLKLAWAITIHKSQGLTFDKAVIDAQESFAHGQVYVALSRCRSLEGMVLSTPISTSSIKMDPGVSRFSQEVEENQPDKELLLKAQLDFKKELILEMFDFKALSQALRQLLKEMKGYRSALILDPVPHAETMQQEIREQIEGVAQKFIVQLNQLFDQLSLDEKALQERIIKGAAYFLEKLERIFRHKIGTLSIDTDNQQVAKVLKSRMESLLLEAQVKEACLESSREGFELKRFLDARARASIGKVKVKQESPADEPASISELSHPELFEKLRHWRNGLAAVQDLPAYRIMGQRALLGISTALPSNIPEMLKIKGIGKRTLEKYGKDILGMIGEYCEEKQIDYQADAQLPIPEKPGRKTKQDSQKVSLELFQQGKSIEEIAAERDMVVTTIETHLASQVEQGYVNIHQLLDEVALKEITEAIEKTGETLLSPLRETLKEKYSYRDLRMAVAWFKCNQV